MPKLHESDFMRDGDERQLRVTKRAVARTDRSVLSLNRSEETLLGVRMERTRRSRALHRFQFILVYAVLDLPFLARIFQTVIDTR